ncbi:MAG: hypothetical protein M3Q05_15360, partial [Bacteroidota bacterium]|nr:hypothetical protein [Bacteroidota bacterium]
GTVGYSRNAVSDEDLTFDPSQVNQKGFSAGPQAGLFITNNLAVGLTVNYKHSKMRDYNSYDSSFQNTQSQTIAFGPFARYYYFIRPELAIFGQGAITYNHDFNEENYFGLSTNVAPGLIYFISPKIGLEMNLGGITYTRGVYKPSDDYRITGNSLELNFLNGAQIGASFYLSR